MNEIKNRAVAQSVNAILTEETDDFHSLVSWPPGSNSVTALVPQRHTVENRTVDSTEIQPVAGFNGANVFNGAVVDFKLDNQDISVIDHVNLCFNITNSTGGAVVIGPTPFLVDKLEIMNPNGNVLCTLTDIDLWQAVMALPRVDYDQIAALISSDTSYSTAGVSIADAASVELYLPIIPFFTATRLHLPGLTGSLTCRFRFKPSTLTLISGSHPTVTKCVLHISGFDEGESKRNMRTRFYKGQIPKYAHLPIYLPWSCPEHFTFTQALAASVKTDIKLSGFMGQYSCLFIIVRVSPITAANAGTYIKLASFSVQDASGQIFSGNHVKTHERSRMIAAAQLNNLAALNKNFYLLPFSSACVQDMAHGQTHGCQILSGNENLSITPNAAAASTTYQIDIIGWRNCALRVQKGQCDKRY